jgi:hypothetical protein
MDEDDLKDLALDITNAVAALFAAALIAFIASSCGGASAEMVARYSAEQTNCLRNERAIIDRPNTTEAQDEADYAAEQARCNAALLAIDPSRTSGSTP